MYSTFWRLRGHRPLACSGHPEPMTAGWRRRTQRQARKPDTDVGVLPLINVVFLLLIFFMLAGRFASEGPFPIRPTESNSETEPGEQELLVVVGPDGTIVLGDRPVGLDELTDLLAMRAERLSPVWLKSDAGAEAVHVVDIMHAIRDAGIEEVRLLTVLAP